MRPTALKTLIGRKRLRRELVAERESPPSPLYFALSFLSFQSFQCFFYFGIRNTPSTDEQVNMRMKFKPSIPRVQHGKHCRSGCSALPGSFSSAACWCSVLSSGNPFSFLLRMIISIQCLGFHAGNVLARYF